MGVRAVATCWLLRCNGDRQGRLLSGYFYGVHSGLAMDPLPVWWKSRDEVAAQMARLEKIGSFV